jgi:DNA-binding beta-propeller fold protein YncE
MSSDVEHGLVFATATTMKTVEIVDVKSGKLLRSLPGDGAAAALFAPEFNRLYVTRSRKVSIYDGKTFELLTNIDLPSSVDELGYNANLKQLYVGCMTSNHTGIAVISIPDGKLKGEVKLPAKPQGFAVEQKGNRIFANMPGPKQVAVIDGAKRILIETWPLKDISGNYPVALDETNHRLMVGCRRPSQLTVLDTSSGKIVASVPVCGDTDDLSYDAKHKRVYIACGEGFVDVVNQIDPDHYEFGEHIPALPGSRNSVLAGDSSQFYLAIPQRENQGAEIRIYRAQN